MFVLRIFKIEYYRFGGMVEDLPAGARGHYTI